MYLAEVDIIPQVIQKLVTCSLNHHGAIRSFILFLKYFSYVIKIFHRFHTALAFICRSPGLS